MNDRAKLSLTAINIKLFKQNKIIGNGINIEQIRTLKITLTDNGEQLLDS